MMNKTILTLLLALLLIGVSFKSIGLEKKLQNRQWCFQSDSGQPKSGLGAVETPLATLFFDPTCPNSRLELEYLVKASIMENIRLCFAFSVGNESAKEWSYYFWMANKNGFLLDFCSYYLETVATENEAWREEIRQRFNMSFEASALDPDFTNWLINELSCLKCLELDATPVLIHNNSRIVGWDEKSVQAALGI